MYQTSEGKWVLFDLATGEQRDYWPIDARALLALGTHSTEPPEGVEPVPPEMPPSTVGAPVTPPAKMFDGREVGDEPDEGGEARKPRARRAKKKEG